MKLEVMATTDSLATSWRRPFTPGSGTFSTEEIKARIEAMFAEPDDENPRTV